MLAPHTVLINVNVDWVDYNNNFIIWIYHKSYLRIECSSMNKYLHSMFQNFSSTTNASENKPMRKQIFKTLHYII